MERSTAALTLPPSRSTVTSTESEGKLVFHEQKAGEYKPELHLVTVEIYVSQNTPSLFKSVTYNLTTTKKTK